MKKILVLNFFPAFVPPKSGGELRYYNFYAHLSKYHDITLLSPTYAYRKQEVITHSTSLREYRVPKEEVHDHLHLEIEKKKIGPECSALVCALSARYPNEYHTAYLSLYPDADIIVHEFPYMLPYDFFFGIDKKPRVYNSHNFESYLVEDIWSGPNAQPYKDYIHELEKKLVVKSDIVFATSDQEKRGFIKDFHIHEAKVKLAPNGINPEEFSNKRKFSEGIRKKAYFIGSGHPPNVEAVRFIISELSHACPDVDFYIAGDCSEGISEVSKENVSIFGKIDDPEKKRLFDECDIAINPMFSGAGTNLKTLEFLSAGLPLIATKVGVRGLDVKEGINCVVADRHDFAHKLNRLASDPAQLSTLSDNGREFVNTNYSWSMIAEGVAVELEDLRTDKKKNAILVLNDYPVATPHSGGEVRINRLYSHLSGFCNVVLLCFSNGAEIQIKEISEGFREISFPKTDAHRREEKRQNTRFVVSVTDIVNSFMCNKNELLVGAVNCASGFTDAIVLSHPYMANLVKQVGNRDIIYESHNFEYLLKKPMLKGHPDAARLLGQVYEIEKRAVDKSKFLIVVSDEDAREIRSVFQMEKETFLIQNGVDIKKSGAFEDDFASVKGLFHGYPVVLFIGSAHTPNIEALEYILKELAPNVPRAYFVVIGSVCNTVFCKMPENVLLCGRLDDEHKDILFRIADVGINPVLEGSGSNLKLAEYFSYKLPVVTTLFGARGCDVSSIREVLICERKEFAGKLQVLFEDIGLQETLAENGYRFAKMHLDWKLLADRYWGVLQSKVFEKREKKRLLVITHRFNDPPLGGAELYLLNIIKVLDQLGDFRVDIATLDIRNIRNKFHFSTEFTCSEASESTWFGSNIPIHRFTLDRIPSTTLYRNSKVLFSLWYKEFIDLSLKQLDKYDRPLLLGGWNFPEKAADGTLRIWSSGRSLIYAPGAEEITIKGFSPRKQRVTVSSDDEAIFDKKLKGHFSIKTPLNGVKILTLKTNAHYHEDDPRSLGILISAIEYLRNGDMQSIPLNYCYRDFLKDHYLAEYVDNLIGIAQQRDEKIDHLFQQTRGPVSEAMEEWLDKQMAKYDVVLGHSIPFQTVILAQRYAKKYNKSVAILPHFHFNDEFYHWRSYYEAMQGANMVLSFPKRGIPLFFDKLKIRSQYLPGGGIFQEEFEDIDCSPFRALYRSTLPFILVLGRKSGSKNYQWVIEAVKEINSAKKRLNVVLIGHDEDGIETDPKDATYLGEQSRSVVLGALKECLAVVNMSESESFGIVILEAWMMDKPVVVNEKCPAFTELVQDNINGLLANRETLLDVILRLLEDPELAVRIGKKGQASVGYEYFWESIGITINEMLLGLVRSKRVASDFTAFQQLNNLTKSII